jgi:outer membrane protein OmpA-like peptidoglycan-associated protein
VPGDEIIFDDNLDKEQMGEFPSRWDLIAGNSEVATANGKKALEFTSAADEVVPLMKAPRNFLGDVFTIEFDVLVVKPASGNTAMGIELDFFGADNPQGSSRDLIMQFSKSANLINDKRYGYQWRTSTGDNKGDGEMSMAFDTWNHIAMSFNKRAWKVYLNGVRVVNVPNVSTPPGWFKLTGGYVGEGNVLYTNFRIAKGAVPLYDRLASDGKIITYGITFDVGKATIKPESMTEINRIAQLMKDNPDIKFSVEGHTDNTGNAASNQTLSENRSKAVMDKLVGMGIAPDRLKSAGKGQTKPLADNATDEGRAKNRRVEFVKM